jgi:hypothetical protein
VNRLEIVERLLHPENDIATDCCFQKRAVKQKERRIALNFRYLAWLGFFSVKAKKNKRQPTHMVMSNHTTLE